MLLYLPERIYNNVLLNDEVYAKMAEEATEKVFVKDFIKSMINYTDENPIIIALKDYILERTPEEYKLELELCFSDDLTKFEKLYKEMDGETKMFWLCEVNNGDMKPTKDFLERNVKFLRLYSQYVDFEPEEYSNFLHIMYYSKILYKRIIDDSSKKDVSKEDINDYIAFEEKTYRECFKKSKDIRYLNMLYSKREQMFVFYFYFVGSKCNDLKYAIEKISNIIYQGKFKYNNFTYFRLIFNFKCFQRYLDKGDCNNAKIHWIKMMNMINYAFENKIFTIKSLNHYNNSFLDEFLDITKYLYYIENNYMTKKYLRIDKFLTEKEKRYLNNKLSIEEQPIIEKHIVHDTAYSYEWIRAKKSLLSMIQ